jgi:NAD(P)-dependent dehydrogenase (short-subunit alcohol dehydrogenase family)|tara:strand:- start:178 stop:882 length:705 start_codon:yes stop_codon:yes gene_type:complete
MKKLIIGATGSIGSALSRKLVSQGKQVHLVGRNESETSALAKELNSTFTVADVLTENYSDQIISDAGDIDGLAFCVGSIDLKPIRLSKKSDYMQSFNLNLISATEIIRACHEKLKSNKGSIILFSTVAAKRGFLNHSIISSAKAAVEGLTVALAAEFAPNIRVNCIAPSLSESKIAAPMLKNEKMAESIAKMHALKRIGKGDDFSSLASFLLSEESSWVTGQIFGVDGGRSSVA